MALALALACGNEATDPDDVDLGQTTAVIVVNPVVNNANQVSIPAPGAARSGVIAAITGGPSGTTDADGVVVLSPLATGTRMLGLNGAGAQGTLSLQAVEGDLQEVAIALTAGGASTMAQIDYALSGAIVEITPQMTVSQVNQALAQSGVVVLFRSGTYAGDLVFAGSDVTLFGEGAAGGQVTLNGNVMVSGSRNRIRGARITGNLQVPGSDFGLSFSRVAGSVDIPGSDAVLLNNRLCGNVTIGGSGALLVGNAGVAPIAAPAGGC